jgi:hypothetical protein
MNTTLDATPLPELPEGEYAIVELLGHRTLIGRISEVERFGTKLLQVEPIFRKRLLEPVLCHGSALYGLTPCTREVAADRAPTLDWQLPQPIRARLEPALIAAPETEDADFSEVEEDEVE